MRVMIHMAIVLGVAGAIPAMAEQYVFPAKGQSEEQQRTDLAACEQWATQQTGVDLKALETERTEKLAAAENMEVEREGGAAARGAIKGAIAGSLAGRDKLRNETAAAGALVGAGAAKKGEQAKAEQTRAQAKAQVEQAYAASKEEFYKARSVCLETKGYNVK